MDKLKALLMRECAEDICQEVLHAKFDLIRSRKHLIYRHRKSGRIYVCASTPSDKRRSAQNQLHILRRVLKSVGEDII